jgi:23S rRNA maturation-related 3'-5' exoribonuclease YhaM
MFEDHKERFFRSPGSLEKHQAWERGYIDHLEQIMDLAIDMCELFEIKYGVQFVVSDVILVLWVHDLEKPFRYVEPKQEFSNDEEKKSFILDLVSQYQIVLTEEHLVALKYIHGEGKDYHPTKRIQTPLAALCHICDTASARILHDKHSM